MEKEFVPYIESLELKELGFDEPCIRGWYEDGGIWYHPDSDIVLDNPTFSHAFRWFREKYGYFTSPTESVDDTSKKYDWLITKHLEDGKMFIKFIGYKNTYEEAELECLKKLIEIVKEKK